jgi:hypothetical protein
MAFLSSRHFLGKIRRKNIHTYIGIMGIVENATIRLCAWKIGKGIRYGQGGEIELYDLESDLAEAHNVAEKFPEVVLEIEEIMKSAFIPNDRYPVGELYKGGPIWTK